MAYNNQVLINPDGYALPSGANSITSQWLDKRSAGSVSLSFTLTGSNAPTGTVEVQTSNVTDFNGGLGGGPQGGSSPVDVAVYPLSSVPITAAGTTRWDITTSSRWVRVVYTASSNVAGLTVNCYGTANFTSP